MLNDEKRESKKQTWEEISQSGVNVIIPSKNFNISDDERLLIPFLKDSKIGFINKDGAVTIEPVFDVISGDIYSEHDFVKVGITYSYAYERSNRHPEIYTRTKWGLYNSKGECIVEPNFSSIIVGNNTIVARKAYGYDYNGEHSLMNLRGETIIPFGVYWDIEPFENGLARCRNKKDKVEYYGLINEQGESVLECNSRHIHPFYGRYKNHISSLKELLKKENPKAFLKYFNSSIGEL